MPQTHHSSSWTVKDLGELKAPLMICGGAYGNLEAFQALIAQADRLSIPPEQIIHTGDIAACCADPVATIELMAGSSIHAIQGNVENSLVHNLVDCGCDNGKGAICDAVSAAKWYGFVDKAVEEKHRRYMGKLPHQLVFRCEGRTVRVVHGSVSSINQFVFASDSTSVFARELALAEADIVISGHSGIPFTRRFDHQVWHNSGCLGLPANDGTHRVWYSLVYPHEVYGLDFQHYALEYDYEKARDKMLFHGLPQGYSKALETGLWPDIEQLPEIERRRAGRPLDANNLVIDELRDEPPVRSFPLRQQVSI